MISIQSSGGRPSWDQIGMAIAEVMALRPVCKNHRVGCAVLDRDHRMISAGYNGPVRGDMHCDEVGCAKLDGVDDKIRRCRGIHSEINAIINTVHPEALKGATIYLTLEPCYDCAKSIAQNGISRVVYLNDYKRVAGKETLESEHDEVADLFARCSVIFEKFNMD